MSVPPLTRTRGRGEGQQRKLKKLFFSTAVHGGGGHQMRVEIRTTSPS